MSEKITNDHLEQKAILYIRQSSITQVERNEESKRLQYAMEARLRQLGWRQIEIIDEDQGCTASGTKQREGFKDMLADVCMGQVGAVAAREVSRFARNSRDWQKLIEVCRMVGTLLIDQEAVYNPQQGNDRLLLGLKGSLNEYELDILRLRAVEARNQKAKRGALALVPPVGFILDEEGQIQLSPDQRIQNALHLVFQMFLQLGSVRQTVLWFVEQELEIPTIRKIGRRWEPIWRRPRYCMIHRILTNPVYAGAYAYGRTKTKIVYKNGEPKKVTRRRPEAEWHALIHDHHEGYIDRIVFERIQKMLANNDRKAGGPGAAKKGVVLLSGLLRCQRCGRKVMVAYTGRGKTFGRYMCRRGALDNGEPRCISFGAAGVDERISQEILNAVQPGAIAATRKAAELSDDRTNQVLKAVQQDLEASQYRVDRARRQFDAVDPENRLVANELEGRWNQALAEHHTLKQRLEKMKQQTQSTRHSVEEFEGLAQHLSSVWHHPNTDVRMKKRIARALIEEIIVDLEESQGEILLTIHWKGGVHSSLKVLRRRRGQSSNHTPFEIVTAVEHLSKICTDQYIAGILNRNKLFTGKGNRWSESSVASLRRKRHIPIYSPIRRKQEGWLNLTEAAQHVNLSPTSVRKAIDQFGLKAIHPLPDSPWILNRNDLDSEEAIRILKKIGTTQGRSSTHEPPENQLNLF